MAGPSATSAFTPYKGTRPVQEETAQPSPDKPFDPLMVAHNAHLTLINAIFNKAPLPLGFTPPPGISAAYVQMVSPTYTPQPWTPPSPSTTKELNTTHFKPKLLLPPPEGL